MSLLWVQELEVRLGGKERRGMFGSEALLPAGLNLYLSPPATPSKTQSPGLPVLSFHARCVSPSRVKGQPLFLLVPPPRPSWG